jgi:hypothetical protein
MRIAALALVGALGFAASAMSVSAAPPVANLDTQQSWNIVQVAGGCGRGFHPNRWGRCVPFRYGYPGPRPYWGGPYRWHSPSDNVANQLNRRELSRGY